MLIRLKNMFDSKMKEAEIASLGQKRKVEELEAQLHEAEDVIIDLRIQLKEAQYQLEKVKNDQMKPFEGKNMNKISFCTSEPQTVSSSSKNMKTKQIAPDATYMLNPIDRSTVSQVDIIYSRDADFTSSVLRRTQEHALYRNSRTQGICAMERNFLDSKFPQAIDVKDKQVLRENEPIVKKRDKDEQSLSPTTGKKGITKNVLAAELKRSMKFHILRRRKSHHGKYKTGSCRLYGSQLMKSRQPSSIISLCRPYWRDGNVRSNKNGYVPPSLIAGSGSVTQGSCVLEGNESNNFNDESGIFIGGKRKEKMKGGNLPSLSVDQLLKPCGKPFILSPCRTSINLVNDSMKSGKFHSNMTEQGNDIKQSTRLDSGFTLTKSYVNSTPVPSCVTTSVKAINRSRVVENTADSKRELMALAVTQESDAIGNMIFSSPLLNSRVNTNTKYEKICEVTNSSPCKVEKKTLLKCTLQRKRKKEATSISDENTSPEKRNRKRRLGEKLKCEPEFESSILVRELSRESRQMSQVAHQLISLSGKRCW